MKPEKYFAGGNVKISGRKNSGGTKKTPDAREISYSRFNFFSGRFLKKKKKQKRKKRLREKRIRTF